MSKLVTIFGGSGFVGRYIARKMAKEGWRVRVAVRRPNEAIFLRGYGAVGQVEPVLCNIRNEASVAQALEGADAAVNCVGTFDSAGANNFDAVHVQAAGLIARLAAASGLSSLVHLSALGADAKGASQYARSKAEGEAAVLAAFPSALILRPSVVFGNEDGFFNRFAAMSVKGPILPLVGGNTRFQPVYVEDVASAAVLGVLGKASGTYELGGPDALSLKALIAQMLTVVKRRRLVVNLPFFVGGIIGGAASLVSALTLRLVPNKILTLDQLAQLRVDNVVSPGAKTLADLGIQPTNLAAVIPEYLWRYRDAGQYAAMRDSAKNLRKA